MNIKNIKMSNMNIKNISMFKKILIILLLILILFYFGYYKIKINIEEVNESFFVSKYENIEIEDENNLYISLKDLNYKEDIINFNIKKDIVSCLYLDECYSLEYYSYIIGNFKRKIKYKKEKIKIEELYKNDKEILHKKLKQIDNLEKKEILTKVKQWEIITDEKSNKITKFFLKRNIDILYTFKDSEDTEKLINKLLFDFSEKKYFKQYHDDLEQFSTDIIGFFRELRYKYLYYLNNGEEKKFANLIKAHIKVSLVYLNGDSNFLVNKGAVLVFENLLKDIELIIENFDLSLEIKQELLELLEENIDDKIMDNTLKNHYKELISSLNINSIFFDREYTEKGFREIYYDMINNNGKISEEVYLKYSKYNIFKANQIGQLLWLGKGDKWGFWGNIGINRTYEEEYKNIENLNILRNKIVNNLKGELN